MKKLILVIFLAFSQVGYAKMVDPAEFSSEVKTLAAEWTKRWEKVKQNVKNKVSSWLDSFTEPKQVEKDQVASKNGEAGRVEPITSKPEKIPNTQNIDHLVKQMPSYVDSEKQSLNQQLKQAQTDLRSSQVLKKEAVGRVGSSQLPRTKEGVPQFSLYHKKNVKSKSGKRKVVKIPVKDIPHLDIGLEDKISSQQLAMTSIEVKVSSYSKPKRLSEPKKITKAELDEWTKRKWKKVGREKTLKRKDWGLGQVVTMEKVSAIQWKLGQPQDLPEKPYAPMNRDDLKMLSALILYAKNTKCHLVSGLFHELSKKEKYKLQSNLYLGLCSAEMGFFSEALVRLVPIIKSENKDYAPIAIEKLVSHVPKEYETTVARIIRNLRDSNLIPKGALDHANYVAAKGSYKSKKYSYAAQYAQKVSTHSKVYPQAQFVLAISEYARGQINKALSLLVQLQKWMVESKRSDKDLESLIHANIARMYFMTGKYKSSVSSYKNISKDHPLWVPALVELGWAQLMTKDAAGAIGNMYSLHSPYFKSVFKPESYAVRTIGYVNICQYGDAYRTLSQSEKRYKNWMQQVEAYQQIRRSSRDVYKTVRTYLLGSSVNNFDGLPYQVIREIARKRNFLNFQESLNQKEDEISQYDFIAGLIRDDIRKVRRRLKNAQSEYAKLNVQLKKAKKNKKFAQNVNQWTAQRRFQANLSEGYKFLLATYKEGNSGFGKLKSNGLKRIRKEKSNLRKSAGEALTQNLVELRDRIHRFLDNNEFLRYEIFAGSGQNIRYQASGGKVKGKNRLPASVKPSKVLNWDFSGEYWEDEIGNYRSSLRNNCPENKMRSFVKRLEGDKK